MCGGGFSAEFVTVTQRMRKLVISKEQYLKRKQWLTMKLIGVFCVAGIYCKVTSLMKSL